MPPPWAARSAWSSPSMHEDDGPVVLLGAGVAATPVLAMLHHLVEAGEDPEVWWVHGARNRREHAFGAEVDGLLAKLPHGHRLVAYSAPEAEDGSGFSTCLGMSGPMQRLEARS